jgi:hypothetical protein
MASWRLDWCQQRSPHYYALPNLARPVLVGNYGFRLLAVLRPGAARALVAVLKVSSPCDRREGLSCHQVRAGVRGHQELVILSRATRTFISGK